MSVGGGVDVLPVVERVGLRVVDELLLRHHLQRFRPAVSAQHEHDESGDNESECQTARTDPDKQRETITTFVDSDCDTV